MLHGVKEWEIIEPPRKAKNCIVALAGRSMGTDHLAKFCCEMMLEHTLIISLRGNNYAWYSLPRASYDQEEAVAGLEFSRKSIEQAISRISLGWGFKKSEIALTGFSAGAVMALYTSLFSNESYCASVSLSGAILEPDKIPECKDCTTDFFLSHSQNDDCFDWYERYLPMKESLFNNGYNLYTFEKMYGGHFCLHRDMLNVSEFLAPRLGYGDDWRHPENREEAEVKRK